MIVRGTLEWMKRPLVVGIDATSWPNPRGYGRFTRGLLTALLSRPREGYTFTLFVDQETDERYELPGSGRRAVVRSHTAPATAAAAGRHRGVRDLWAMSQAIGRTPLDVLYFPTVFTYVPARTAAKVLLGVHDIIAETFSDLVFPTVLHRRLWQWKGRLGRRQAHTIVTVSDYAAAGIAQRFNWPADRLWVVGEAPDPLFKTLPDPSLTRETLRRYGLAPPARYLICLGGLNPHKNIGMLLYVLAELRRDPAFADLRLALVGPAEEDTFTPGVADVRRRALQLGLENCVVLTGYLPDEEVRCLLAYAQLLALPSLMEGYGLAAVEAAACGIPVAATRNSPLPELLEGGGVFLDPQQPEAWRDAIAALLRDEERRRQMGAAARRRAAALSWEQAADCFLMLLDRLRDEDAWAK